MHKLTNFTIIFFMFILLITGCTQNNSQSSLKGPYQTTGNKMIEANFLKDSPISAENDPYRVGDEIDVVVELKNKHTEDIPEGNVLVRLTGDAAIPTFFEGAREVTAPTLLGYDSEINQANPEEVELGPIRYVGDLPTKLSKTISGQYCYSYPVKVKAFVYYTDDPNKIGTNLPSGSNPASSVQVTKLTQQAVYVKDGVGTLRFRATIKNLGTGEVLPSLQDCFQYRERREKEYLTVEASAAYSVTCDNDGLVRLSKDTREKTISCEIQGIDPTNLGDKPSELTLTLTNFAYQDEIPPVKIWLEP